MAQRKPYNPNTKYGRRKMREQAQYNYDNGTPEYRADIDNTKTIVWIIVFVIVVIVVLIGFSTGHEKETVRWLSH